MNARTRNILGVFAIVSITAIVYLPALFSGFIWDDNHWLWENPPTLAADGLKDIWTGNDPPDFLPVTSTTFWLEWRLWGKSAPGYHLTNIMLHIACSLLLWRVLVVLKVPGAWLAAMAFAVHPVNVASVAWITERKNTLSLLFMLGAMLAYFRFESATFATDRDKPSDLTASQRGFPDWCWYPFAIVLYMLALGSKGSVVIMPPTLLLCAWWQRGRVTWRDAAATMPLFALAFLSASVTWYFQHNHAIRGATVRLPQENFASVIAAAGWAVWFYFYKALVPLKLVMVYPRWSADPTRFYVYLPLLAIMLLLIRLYFMRRTWGRPWLFAMAYTLLALAPVLGLVPMYYMRFSLVADHWQYLAMIGWCAMFAGTIVYLRQRGAGSLRLPMTIIATVWLLALSVLTFRQASVYKDAQTLWLDNIAKYPNSWKPYYNLAVDLKDQHPNDPARYRDAIRYLHESIRHFDQDDSNYALLGQLHLQLGEPGVALGYYKRARDLSPTDPMRHNDVGAAYQGMGLTDNAIEQFRGALKVEPEHGAANSNLAIVLHAAGRLEEAIPHYAITAKLKPDDAETHRQLGGILARLNRHEEALPYMRRAAELMPSSGDVLSDLGVILASLGRSSEAIQTLERAIRLDPTNVSAASNLGSALVNSGRYDEAANLMRQVVQIAPDFGKAHYNYAVALQNLHHRQEALTHFRLAARLDPNWVHGLLELSILLSTSEDESLRSGSEAMALAQRAVMLTNRQYPPALNALAAAHAELGRFDDALTVARESLQLAQHQQQPMLVSLIAAQIQLYEQGKPMRLPPPDRAGSLAPPAAGGGS